MMTDWVQPTRAGMRKGELRLQSYRKHGTSRYFLKKKVSCRLILGKSIMQSDTGFPLLPCPASFNCGISPASLFFSLLRCR